MPVKTPALLWNTAEEIRNCICLELNAQGSCPCPCRTCIIVGTPVFDDCCEGQLTVSLQRLFPHSNFPTRLSGPVFCGVSLAAEFLITYIRCAPVVGDDGVAPSCDVLSENAIGIYSDLYIVYRALVCCLALAKRTRKFVIGDATLINDGGCQGFEIRVTIEIEDTLSD